MNIRNAFQSIFGNKKKTELSQYFQMLDGYTPIFSTYDGGVYEMEITRAAIHAFASHCSKLCPNVLGADLKHLQRLLETKPNEFMTSSQFLYKVATIYEAQNTCFIVPIEGKFGEIVGLYPVNPTQVEIMEYNKKPYFRYTFKNGNKACIELERVGVVSKFLYKNDIIGESNRALNPTMQLLQLQREGIQEGIKNGASFRFMANVSNFTKPEDLKKERDRFVSENFGSEGGGLALFPNTYTNVQQINSHANIVDTEQIKLVQERVYNYFGCNENILQNKSVGDEWSAYYEGKIEPFAIQLSQALTCMVYTSVEISRGNEIQFSSNRLQYMTNADKLQMASQMFDRGILSINNVMDIWNLPRVEDGDKRYIRKEYVGIENLDLVNLNDYGKDVENDTTGQTEV